MGVEVVAEETIAEVVVEEVAVEDAMDTMRILIDMMEIKFQKLRQR